MNQPRSSNYFFDVSQSQARPSNPLCVASSAAGLGSGFGGSEVPALESGDSAGVALDVVALLALLVSSVREDGWIVNLPAEVFFVAVGLAEDDWALSESAEEALEACFG